MLAPDLLSPATIPTLQQHYTVSMPDPTNHLFEVNWQILGVDRREPLILKMPVWTPGSYLVREYARHLQDLEVWDDQGHRLSWQKLSKNTWQLPGDPTCTQPITLQITYRIYAYELTVRTNHLDPTHGYFNGAALFLYCPDRRWDPLTLTIIPPYPEWQIATSLLQWKPSPDSASIPGAIDPINASRSGQTFLAHNYDELVDSPVEIGIHRSIDFEVQGKPHRFVVWGQGNLDLDRLAQDTSNIVQTAAQIFGGDLPYQNYLFLLHLAAEGFGGLEHRSSTSLNFSRFEFHLTDRYQRFLALIAHEFFHTWNVKRLRPKALEIYDYDQETYLTTLWFCEGATSYYELLILRRAGLIDAETVLRVLSERITRLQTISGRQIQSLTESSYDTWIKLYRPHENTINTQISYYLKGSLVCWLLDLHIRHSSQGSRSFDTVFQDLWQRFGQIERGYTDAELQAALAAAAGHDLTDFFNAYIHGTAELDYNTFLQPFGLHVQPRSTQAQPAPYLGIHLRGGDSKIVNVGMGSPAQKAGIWAGDEWLALDGFKVAPNQVTDRLKSYAAYQTVAITVFQAEQLKTFWVCLDPPQPDTYLIEPMAAITVDQQQLYHNWLEMQVSSGKLIQNNH